MDRTEELERRIVGLERDLRAAHWDRIGAAVVTVVGFACLVCLRPEVTAQAVPDVKVVRAQQFVVEDAQGRPRAMLGTALAGPGAGAASLTFRDAAGGHMISIGQAGEGEAIVSVQAADGSGVALLAPRRGRPRFVLTDPAGRETSFPPDR
jgi:hypothetical protein